MRNWAGGDGGGPGPGGALSPPREPGAAPRPSQPFLPFSRGGACVAGRSPLGALVEVVLAVDALEARLALAGVTVDVVGAGPAIPAGLTQTLVHVCLALVPREARKAQAGERIHPVRAGTSVLAGI